MVPGSFVGDIFSAGLYSNKQGRLSLAAGRPRPIRTEQHLGRQHYRFCWATLSGPMPARGCRPRLRLSRHGAPPCVLTARRPLRSGLPLASPWPPVRTAVAVPPSGPPGVTCTCNNAGRRANGFDASDKMNQASTGSMRACSQRHQSSPHPTRAHRSSCPAGQAARVHHPVRPSEPNLQNLPPRSTTSSSSSAPPVRAPPHNPRMRIALPLQSPSPPLSASTTASPLVDVAHEAAQPAWHRLHQRARCLAPRPCMSLLPCLRPAGTRPPRAGA